MSDYDVFQEIVDVLPDTISNLNSGLIELNTSIDGLTDEKAAIEWSFSLMTTAAETWLDWKANDLNPTYTVSTTGDFGVSNVHEWAIINPAAGKDNSVVYSDTDVTSASPPTLEETQQYNRQIGFPEAYDHIHRTNDLAYGTYGIDARKSGLNTGKGLMELNRDKYATVLKVYDRVLREK